MTRDILGSDRFVQRSATPVQKLGRRAFGSTATDALDMLGNWEVEKEPIYDRFGNLIPDKNVLVGPNRDYWNIVSDNYELITPAEFAGLWDRSVNRPVDVVGSAKDGQMFFITTPLESYDVDGDPVENTMIAWNGMEGRTGCYIRILSNRLFCTNQLVPAQGQVGKSVSIYHNAGAIGYLEEWLGGVYEMATRQNIVLKEAYEILAGITPTPEQIETVLRDTYPRPSRPRRSGIPSLDNERDQNHQRQIETIEIRRDGAMRLFNGEGWGQSQPATNGTLYGLYNAIVEEAQYSSGGSDDAVARAMVFGGPRQKRAENGFRAVLKIANINVDAMSKIN